MYYGERLNSISHLVGAGLALVGLGALLAISIQIGDPMLIFSFSIFGLALVLMYAMSTLYHSFRMPKLKDLFQLFDHIAIYVLIAGTYTPFTLISLREGNGWQIFPLVWALAAIGIFSEVFLSGRLVKIGQMLIYLGMGWVGAVEFSDLRVAISDVGLYWLIAGGLAYTLGVVFYLLDNARMLTHAHGIWHFFVLVGSICHFVSTIGYVR
ncbi:MAG TPA: hemolysin III [Planctomycetaceae bacterium]|nr:hemolysin III [Planctomycetaceae bacterium]